MGFFRFLVIGMFYEIVIWLRIFELRRPKKNPANLKAEFGDSCKSCGSLRILSQDFILPKKAKACSQKILPSGTGVCSREKIEFLG
jgi:hypothetical protein